MGTANRLQLAACRETTPGTTPNTPRMRAVRITKEALNYTPSYIDSDELRSDRMNGDSIQVMTAADGSLDFELTYPDDNSPASEIWRSAFWNAWTNTPSFDNDGSADSVITDAGTVANTYAVTSGGAAVKANHLVRATGFTNPANNQIFPVASSSGTTVVGTALGLTAEAAPPGTARLKVIGFAGASADITAAAGGLASTVLDFTTLGLNVGGWLKIDSTTSAYGFATAANNTWIRITAIAAHALTCDNLPSGWSVDAGTGKTIRCYFGDQIKNGTTQTSLSIEKGFLDQGVPTYIMHRGMTVNTLSLNFKSRDKITGTVAFLGMGGGQSTTAADASIDAATTGQVMAANANVGRIGEAGAQVTSPNWASALSLQIANNLRALESVDQTSPVGINPGDNDVTGQITTYFGDNTLLAKLFSGAASSINARVSKNNQALIFSVPREILRDGSPQATGKNTDVMFSPSYKASVDTLTNAQILLDRIEWFN